MTDAHLLMAEQIFDRITEPKLPQMSLSPIADGDFATVVRRQGGIQIIPSMVYDRTKEENTLQSGEAGIFAAALMRIASYKSIMVDVMASVLQEAEGLDTLDAIWFMKAGGPTH